VEYELHRSPWLAAVKTILIVDRDLGFVFWLGQVLDAAGFVAVPAKAIADAAEVVDLLRLPVSVLIAPAAEQGLAEFVERLRFTSPDLQVIALTSDSDPLVTQPIPGAIPRQKPRYRNEATKAEWLDLVQDSDCNCIASMSRF